jgi:hypothetical protein
MLPRTPYIKPTFKLILESANPIRISQKKSVSEIMAGFWWFGGECPY